MPGIGNYRYKIILRDKIAQMRFLITMKSKNAIYDESKFFFRKIETFTSKKMQYFWSDNVRKYQLLVPYLEEKDIIWEKSAPYAQDQDRVAKFSICIIIEKAYTILINTELLVIL